MHALKYILVIFSAIVQLHAKHTLLPPSEMHPIEPADLNWHMKVFTPPNEYAIYLKPGYSIKDHMETIGKDLSAKIRQRWEDPEIFEHAHFVIVLPDSDRADLDLIRRDPEVDLIIEHAEYQAMNDPIPEEDRGPKTARHDEL
jgi:hypothetical protein